MTSKWPSDQNKIIQVFSVHHSKPESFKPAAMQSGIPDGIPGSSYHHIPPTSPPRASLWNDPLALLFLAGHSPHVSAIDARRATDEVFCILISGLRTESAPRRTPAKRLIGTNRNFVPKSDLIKTSCTQNRFKKKTAQGSKHWQSEHHWKRPHQRLFLALLLSCYELQCFQLGQSVRQSAAGGMRNFHQGLSHWQIGKAS